MHVLAGALAVASHFLSHPATAAPYLTSWLLTSDPAAYLRAVYVGWLVAASRLRSEPEEEPFVTT